MASPKRGLAITGASGWIGRAMTHMALDAMSPGRVVDLRLYGSTAGTTRVGGRDLKIQALSEAEPLGDGEWLVLHLAVAGADREPDPVRLAALNDAMLDDALRLAESGRTRRFVAFSSGAVHQAGQGPAAKHAYAALKIRQEQAVRAWADRLGIPLMLPRVFNVGGPYMTYAGGYALGSLVQQALAGGSVEIGATRPVIRSYVHVLELARVVYDLALSDEPVELFETRGMQDVEMADLAAAVGPALGLDLDIRRPPMTSSEADRYVGDGTAYRAALAASRTQPMDLARIIRDTAAWLKACV